MVFNEEKYVVSNEIPAVKTFTFPHGHLPQKLNLTYNTSENQAVSLPRTPYCGFSWEGKLSEDFLRAGLQQFEEQLLSQKVEGILIRQAPECVLASAQFLSVFEEMGFENKPEINHHIELESYDINSIHTMQRRRIKKCANADFLVQKETREQAEKVHQFIAQCRTQQGLTINIDLPHFIRIFDQMPDSYEIYSVWDSKGNRCAATVTIRVSDHVVYNFLPAFDRSFSDFSPLALLYFEVAQKLKQNGYKYFDLGISSINGQPQDSLIQFKERMGGLRSMRATLSKQL